MESMENIKKYILKFIKTLNPNLSSEVMKTKLEYFLEEKNFDVDRELLVKVLEDKVFLNNLILLDKLENSLSNTIEEFIVQESDGTINISGKIEYIDLEGGFWGIKTEDENYSPINLPKELKKNNLELDLTVRRVSSLVTTLMWGKSIEILSYIIKNK